MRLQTDKILEGYSSLQYLVFSPLEAKDLVQVERERDRKTLGTRTRSTYYEHEDDELLIVLKLIPSPLHNMAVLDFGLVLHTRVCLIGGRVQHEFCPLGNNRIRGQHSSKEADAACKPRSLRRHENDWPTEVFECGISEGLRQLRVEARWWLINSAGDIKIVMLISVKPTQSTICFETWELAPAPEDDPESKSANGTCRTTKLQEIMIVPNVLPSTSMTLGFKKIFLRPAVAPESDFVFTPQELADFAKRVWDALQ